MEVNSDNCRSENGRFKFNGRNSDAGNYNSLFSLTQIEDYHCQLEDIHQRSSIVTKYALVSCCIIKEAFQEDAFGIGGIRYSMTDDSTAVT